MQVFSSFCAKCSLLLSRFGGVCALVAAACGCSADDNSAAAVANPVTPSYRCGSDGYLTTELFGAIQAELQWSAAELECEGMARPDGEGARLRFAGAFDGRRIAIIIALPELRRGITGKELATTVTVIEEGSGRFFSTADQDICWTDVAELQTVDESNGRYRISGQLYCVAPLTQVNGGSDILVRDLEFRGQLDWGRT